MSQKEFSQVTDEFLKQNSEYVKIKKHIKKGGPYSKNDKDKRMNEVYRLHFEYGYSARKIAEMMNVNRNTINGDIDYWYDKILKDVNYISPANIIKVRLEEMDIQKTRLREQLDKVKYNSERITIERLMFDINSKILNTYQKLADSTLRTHEEITEKINRLMKKQNMPRRVISYFDIISASEKAQQRIKRILKEDREKGNFWGKF